MEEKLIEKILDEIIEEARTGEINCEFLIPICFNAKVLDDGTLKETTIKEEINGCMIPTLIIKNKEKVIKSIKDYLDEATKFYVRDYHLDDTLRKEKFIISSLLSNMLITDFTDFDQLFKRHHQFIKNDYFKDYVEPKIIGYSPTLKADISVQVKRQSIKEETPYAFAICIEKELEDGNKITYPLPLVRFGIANNKAYIYAVQEENNNIVKDKKIERILRKTGEGFDEKNEPRDPILYPENIYSVSPWALVALTISISLLEKEASIREIEAPSFLINRWNAPKISNKIWKDKYQKFVSNEKAKEILEKKRAEIEKEDERQRNISDKFIRNFLRLQNHFEHLEIDEYQFEKDASLHFHLGDVYRCNNTLLNELYFIYEENNKKL